MPVPNLDDQLAALDAACLDHLGELISYTPAGGSALSIRAYVDYTDGEVFLGAGQAVEQEITVSLLKASVPAKPGNSDRLTLARKTGQTFRPTGAASDASGTHWTFTVKEV